MGRGYNAGAAKPTVCRIAADKAAENFWAISKIGTRFAGVIKQQSFKKKFCILSWLCRQNGRIGNLHRQVWKTGRRGYSVSNVFFG